MSEYTEMQVTEGTRTIIALGKTGMGVRVVVSH